MRIEEIAAKNAALKQDCDELGAVIAGLRIVYISGKEKELTNKGKPVTPRDFEDLAGRVLQQLIERLRGDLEDLESLLPTDEGNAPPTAPQASRLPQDMSKAARDGR